MLRLPPLHPEDLKDVLSEVGAALWQVQNLEFTISHYLVMVHKLEPGVARKNAEKVFEDISKKTLGNLLNDLQKHEPNTSALVARLENFVPKRNWLVHGSRHGSENYMFSESKRPLLIGRLTDIADDALSLSKLFLEATEAHLKTHGITRNQIEDMAKKIIESWVDA